MSIHKTELDRVNKVVGKTIKSVTLDEEWRGYGDIDSLIIKFTDGSSLYISGISNSGCNECDPDGCNGATLNIS